MQWSLSHTLKKLELVFLDFDTRTFLLFTHAIDYLHNLISFKASHVNFLRCNRGNLLRKCCRLSLVMDCYWLSHLESAVLISGLKDSDSLLWEKNPVGSTRSHISGGSFVLAKAYVAALLRISPRMRLDSFNINVPYFEECFNLRRIHSNWIFAKLITVFNSW